ncbi:copper-fist-domain-containing protein [Backusella circina FSU 941]|nr:copper-fist-domain-containing protein [Backusella circina FSU 941]
MIVIDDIKYACHKCIKGHRSSRCDHTERPLIAVRRKGRPVSQCNSCREQRKLKHIHQKCSCHDKTNKNDKSLTTFYHRPLKTFDSRHHVMSVEALLS